MRMESTRLFELKNQALDMKGKYGWGKRRIAQALGISENTVRNWICYNANPLEHHNLPSLNPSHELSYIIGVSQGDGSYGCYRNGKWHKIYEVKLSQVKDKDFALEFHKCLIHILLKGKPYIYYGKDGYWNAKVRSKILVNFLMDDDAWREVVEAFPADFIRGFFDSEGNVYFRNQKSPHPTPFLKAYNTNWSILEYIKSLLAKKFGIRSSISTSQKGKGHKGTKPVHVLGIYDGKSVKTYLGRIGFCIERKRFWMG